MELGFSFPALCGQRDGLSHTTSHCCAVRERSWTHLSWTAVSSGETHLLLLVLTPQEGCGGKAATEGAASPETSASSNPALP